jgi:hypothetical protein
MCDFALKLNRDCHDDELRVQEAKALALSFSWL